jgi:type I restriction enzyme S subunit
MSTSKPVDLPSGWVMSTLSEVFDHLQYGFTAKADHETGNGPRFLRITDLKDTGVDWATVPYCAVSAKEASRYVLGHGDFVFARSGSIEKAWRVIEPPNAIFASYLIRGRPLHKDIGLWLAWFIKSNSYLQQIGAAGAGIGMSNVSAVKLGAVEFPIAPKATTRRILAKLDALQVHADAAKAALDAIGPLLEKFRQSVLAAAFRGDLTRAWREAHPDVEPASVLLARIRAERRRKWEEANPRKKYVEPEPVDASGLPELPVGWCWASLAECGEVARGKSKHRPRNDERLFAEGAVPFIQTGEVARSGGIIKAASRFYSEFGLAQSRLFPVGTVCITIAANIADTAVLAIPACFPDSIVGVVLADDLVSSEFLEKYVRTVRSGLERFAPATAQKNINLEILETVAVPIPPIAERHQIELAINAGIDLIDALDTKMSTAQEALSTLNQSILAKAFRGELVPQDPADEPASVLLERIRREREGTVGSAGKRGRPARS